MDNILQKILDIKPDNIFLKYIVKRVTRRDYRGTHKSQHNRYTIDDLENILSAIRDVVGTKRFLIPPGDMTNEPRVRKQVKNNYPDYVAIVDRVYERIKRGTMNSLKKNFFVDFSRMGFIERYDHKDNLLKDQPKKGQIKTVSISQQGVDLLEAKDLYKKHKIFTDGVERLLGDTLIDLVSAIDLSDYREEKFHFQEYALIFSDDILDGSDKIKIFRSWRFLNRSEREKALSLIKTYCTPERFAGNKSSKRDYHNWMNETQQLMQLFKATVYFQVFGNQFSLNTGKEFGIFANRRNRSVKDDYFREHKVEKREDYELHHIIPLSYAVGQMEYKLIDDYKNLVYVHKNKHREIKRVHIRFRPNDPKVHFVNISDESDVVTAKNKKDAEFYSPLLSKMARYNKKILKSIGY